MDEALRRSLTNPETWKRGAVMLLYFLLLAVVTPIVMLISLVGWVGLLFGGRFPEQVSEFGQSLAGWYLQAIRYLTGNANRRPFPFEDLDCPSDAPVSGYERVAPAPSTDSARRSSGAESAAKAKVPEATAAATSSGASQARKKATGKAPSGKKPSAGKKSASKKSASKKTVSKKTVSKKTVSKKVAEKKAGEAPVARKSARKKPAINKDAGSQPAGEASAGNSPSASGNASKPGSAVDD